MNDLVIQEATEKDLALILSFIKELADYEHLSDQVTATEEILHQWLFVENKAKVVIAYYEHQPVGFALYFYNFSTFLGRAGIYLEDFYVRKEHRKKGFGKAILKKVAGLAIAQGCGRLEWSCLNWNKPSIDFYLSTGAIPMSDWTVYRLSGEALENFSK